MNSIANDTALAPEGQLKLEIYHDDIQILADMLSSHPTPNGAGEVYGSWRDVH